jgi:hypothetical protein
MTFNGKTADQMSVDELEAAFREAERGKQMAANHYGMMLTAQQELTTELATRPEYAERTVN